LSYPATQPSTGPADEAFREHQLVRTRRVVRCESVDLPPGTVGVVVDIYGQGDAYEVEFDIEPGLVLTLERAALEAAQ
jgi:hypothetical protein